MSAFKPGTSLQTIIDFGVIRDFKSEQIIAEAAELGFVIDESVIQRNRDLCSKDIQRWIDDSRTGEANEIPQAIEFVPHLGPYVYKRTS